MSTMITDLYEVVEDKYKELDVEAVREDVIINLIGKFGLGILLENDLIEICDEMNGMPLYKLCDI